MDLQVEAYIKDFTQLTNINREMISNFDNEFIIERGLSKGVDFLIKYKNKQLYLWTVYSLGIIQRYDEGDVYFPHFDRRHNLNFVSSFTFGSDNSWKADFVGILDQDFHSHKLRDITKTYLFLKESILITLLKMEN